MRLKEKMPGEAINRMRHDPNFDITKAFFVFTHRGIEGEEKTWPIKDVMGISGMFAYMDSSYEDHMIPLHRIRKILYDGKVIWRRAKIEEWEHVI